MREVNFSIPNVNKAAVGITTALYDRRALDCTSSLPLINSLNHLAYLTTSSARIREILTQDGGIERLVCLLKQGRSRDFMSIWKWNLAFQCVVNIGVRGTEDIRTRVVEADMVPVIATLLDSYHKLVEKCRDKAEEAKQKQQQTQLLLQQQQQQPHGVGRAPCQHSTSFTSRTNPPETDQQRSSRRQAPPPSIDISATYAGPSATVPTPMAASAATTPAAPPLAASVDRADLVGSHHLPSIPLSHDGRPAVTPARAAAPPPGTSVPAMDHVDELGRTGRDPDRQGFEYGPGPGAGTVSNSGTMTTFHHVLASQPASPTTPLPPVQVRPPTVRANSVLGSTTRSRRRPSIRHQSSTAAESDDANGDGIQSDESVDTEMTGTTDGIQATVGIQDITMDDTEGLLTDLTAPTVLETQDTDTFNITHPDSMGAIINPTNPTPTAPAMGLSPTRPVIVSPSQPVIQSASMPRFLMDRHFTPPASVVAAMPRDEDILMSLQLLAYISKYCGLRSYFQQSHLVPRLKLDTELHMLDNGGSYHPPASEERQTNEEEYLMPNDFNVFPLVEKFTVRLYSQDMQYWAGVVMRNLCRKDDTRGGIRQCAYYQCGKWEEYTRQFAKCRRCRRTKYCSKDCQKSAWAFHRHWCVSVSQ